MKCMIDKVGLFQEKKGKSYVSEEKVARHRLKFLEFSHLNVPEEQILGINIKDVVSPP